MSGGGGGGAHPLHPPSRSAPAVDFSVISDSCVPNEQWIHTQGSHELSASSVFLSLM